MVPTNLAKENKISQSYEVSSCKEKLSRDELAKIATETLFKILSHCHVNFSFLKKQIQWIRGETHQELLIKKVKKDVKARFFGKGGPHRCGAPGAIAVHYQLTEDLDLVKKWKVDSDPWLNVELFYKAGKVVTNKEHAVEIGKQLTKYHDQMGYDGLSAFYTYMKPLYFAAQILKENGGETLPEEYFQAKKYVKYSNHGMYGGKQAVKELLTFLIDQKFYQEGIEFLQETLIGKDNKDQLFHHLARKACKEDCFALSEKALQHLSADCLFVECYTDCSIIQAKKGNREKALELLEKAEEIASTSKEMNPVSKNYPTLGRIHLNSLDELKIMSMLDASDVCEKCIALKHVKPSMLYERKKWKRFSSIPEKDPHYHDYIRSIYAKKVEDPMQFKWVYQASGHQKDLALHAKCEYWQKGISNEKCKTLGRLLAKEEILDQEKLSERLGPYYKRDKVIILNALLKQLKWDQVCY